MPKEVIAVMQDLTGKKRPQIVFDLTERELAAIGEVTVQWAYLEHKILELTITIAKALGTASSDDASHFSFDRRLAYLTASLKSPTFANEENRQKYLQLVHRIHRLKNDRHKIS